MTTVREICTDALIELGVLDPSEQMDGSSAAFALRTLNRLLQVWNTEDLMVYTVNRTTSRSGASASFKTPPPGIAWIAFITRLIRT